MTDKLNFSVEYCFEKFVGKYLTFLQLKKFYAFRFIVHPVKNATHNISMFGSKVARITDLVQTRTNFVALHFWKLSDSGFGHRQSALSNLAFSQEKTT